MKNKLNQEIWNQSKEWINAIGEVIKQLAKQLGVGAEHVYKVYTMQMFVEGLVYAIITLAIIVTLITLIIKTYTWTASMKDLFNKGTIRVLVTILGIAGVLVLTFVVFIPHTLQALNPEYYTLKFLMDNVKELVNKK